MGTQGLHEGDATDQDIWSLTAAATIAMGRSMSSDKDACSVAALLVQCCQKRQGAFNSTQLDDLGAALGSLQERVLQQELNSAGMANADEGLTILDPWDMSGFDKLEMPSRSLHVEGHNGK